MKNTHYIFRDLLQILQWALGTYYVPPVLAPRFIFISRSHYIVTERVKSRFHKDHTNVTKIRCKYCKVHQITNRPFTSPHYRYANFHFQNL